MSSLPDGWEAQRLRDCIVGKPEYGANSPSVAYDSALPRYIRITDITGDGRLSLEGVVSVKLDGNEQYILKDKDFLFARSGATVGKSYLYRESDGWAIYAGYLIKFSVDKEILLPEYLDHFTRTYIYWYWVQTTLRAGAQPNINAQEYSSLPIPLPPLAEQRAIADILSTWDEAIALTEQLIAAVGHLKKGLMQQLLTGQTRFPQFDGEWEEVRLGDYLNESRIPGSDGETARKLTVKLYGKGVQEKDEIRLGSKSTKYYVRRAGQFIYSKLDFLNGAFGIIPDDLDGYETTLDLPAFDVLDELNTVFLLNYVTRESFYKRQLGRARGGRKARRVPPSEVESIRLHLPRKNEQDAIADVALDSDLQIALYKGMLLSLQEQKKGLMQQLLTGQIRVGVG